MHGNGNDKKTTKKQARELTSLRKQALESTKHHEEGNPPRRSDCTCTALLPLAAKIAKAYEPRSKVIQQTELMEGLRDIYDIRPRRKESVVDWLTEVPCRLEWRDLAFHEMPMVLWPSRSKRATSETRAWGPSEARHVEAQP